jgi:hypothetical protein
MFAGNVPAAGIGFKWGSRGTGRDVASGAGANDAKSNYAMNIRAAEAIVSSAPKPMKIFPIKEVWSQVEPSLPLLLAITGAAGVSAEAIAKVVVGGLPSCSARSTSLS